MKTKIHEAIGVPEENKLTLMETRKHEVARVPGENRLTSMETVNNFVWVLIW